MRIVVMEVPIIGNIFVDIDGNRYVQAVVCDDGDKYCILVNIDSGIAYRYYTVAQLPL